MRAAFHLLARHRERSFVILLPNQLGEPRRSCHVCSLADVDEVCVRADHERFESAEARVRLYLRHHARRDSADGFADRTDVVGRRAAAAPGNIQPAIARKFPQIGGHALRSLIETAKGIGKPRVWIASDRNGREARELFEERAHLFCSERAIHSDAKERHVRNGNPKSVDRLSRECSPAAIDDRDRDDHRNALPRAFEIFLDCKKRRLSVERIENRFHQQKIDAAFHQSLRLGAVCLLQLIEGHRPCRGIRDVVRDRGRFRCRPHGAGYEALSLPMRRHVALHGLSRDLRPGKTQIGDAILERILRHGDRIGVERIRFDNVGARFQVLQVDLLDDLGLGQIQDVIIQAQIPDVPREFFAAVCRLIQFARLNHRAHSAIEQQDASVQERIEFVADLFARAHRYQQYLNLGGSALPQASSRHVNAGEPLSCLDVRS